MALAPLPLPFDDNSTVREVLDNPHKRSHLRLIVAEIEGSTKLEYLTNVSTKKLY